MLTACDMIRLADATELNDIIYTLIHHYSKVNPDWEMGIYVIQKSKDRSKQIDDIIAFLEYSKTAVHGP